MPRKMKSKRAPRGRRVSRRKPARKYYQAGTRF